MMRTSVRTRVRARNARLAVLGLLLTFFLMIAGIQGRASTYVATSSQQESGTAAGEQPSGADVLAQESRDAEGEGEEGQFKHSASVKLVAKITGLSLEHAYWLSVLVNFAIVAGLIAWLSKKNLPGIFRDRTAFIQKAMEEARKASENANRRLAEVETRLSRLDAEIGEMKAAADKDFVAEEARIKAAAEEDAAKIVQSAEQEIEAAAKSARRELKAYAADLAVTLATKQIKVDSATDQALVRGFSQQLSSDGSRKGGQ